MGRGSFAQFWREVLTALDSMSPFLINSSRLFRHHVAISRRRITKLDSRVYGVTTDDTVELLRKAIEDINYALDYIDYTPGSDTDANLLNSVAKAYIDLAKAEVARSSSTDLVAELRRLANDATRRAFDLNPTNSFVIETYISNLLQQQSHSVDETIDHCIEALRVYLLPHCPQMICRIGRLSLGQSCR